VIPRAPFRGAQQKSRPVRVGSGLLLAVSLFGARVQAEPAAESRVQCLEAYETGQRARRAGAFASASEAFAFCGGKTCPAAMHADCSRWLSEIESSMPTSVFRVTDAQGKELGGATVRVDRGPARRLDGRALEVDPGEHILSFSVPEYRGVERRFTFNEGEKLVLREVVLEAVSAKLGSATSAPNAPPSEATAPTVTRLPIWLGLGVAVLGGVGFASLGAIARSEERALDSCAPACRVSQTDRVAQHYLWANVSLGVGVAGALTAAAWALFAPDAEPQTAIALGSFQLDLGPTLSLRHRF
jgi:hypothetical protein